MVKSNSSGAVISYSTDRQKILSGAFRRIVKPLVEAAITRAIACDESEASVRLSKAELRYTEPSSGNSIFTDLEADIKDSYPIIEDVKFVRPNGFNAWIELDLTKQASGGNNSIRSAKP